ncbi:MAG: hypothetical protein IT443_06430 [Phycisphaeraceae bacterium]|nr:hypothetical protein [Phycisphaeraceae bacterium]
MNASWLGTVWEKAENLIIVTVVTALIWLYAEGESVRSGTATLTLRFVPPAGQTLAIDPAERRVELEYRCSTSEEQKLKELVRNPVPIVVRPDPTAAVRSVSLRERVASDSPIAALGLEVVAVQPEAIELRVRELERVELPIVVVTGQKRLTGPPVVEPAKAAVQLPRDLSRQSEGTQLRVMLDDVTETLEPGREYKIALPIRPPPQLGSEVKVDPARAEVTFSVSSRTRTLSLSSVRVMIMGPPREMARYEVILRDDLLFLPDAIEITGPNDKIEQIAGKPDQIVAVLRLTAEELTQRISNKQVEIPLPEGVTTRLPPPRVNFTIEPRAGGGMSPATGTQGGNP